MGQPDAYRTYCDKLLAGLAKDDNEQSLSLVAWSCALKDGGVEQNAKLLPLAPQLDAAFPDDRHWSFPVNLILYRNGKYEEALSRLNREIADNSFGNSTWGWLFLAMTHHRLGNRDEALKWFEKATSAELLEAERTMYWAWRLDKVLLRREAAELLGVEAQSTAID